MLRGWKRSWSRPAYFFDNVPRLLEIGRGSPTGLVCYDHHQFPDKYRGGIFYSCWTQGRIYFFPLTPKGASYQSKVTTFIETVGDVGFAPVDVEVGPAGDLFIAIGGRGTRGSVYRVRWVGEKDGDKDDVAKPQAAGDGDAVTRGDDKRSMLESVLNAPQPLSSWSRAKWEPMAEKVEAKQLLRVIADKTRSNLQRIRAVDNSRTA